MTQRKPAERLVLISPEAAVLTVSSSWILAGMIHQMLPCSQKLAAMKLTLDFLVNKSIIIGEEGIMMKVSTLLKKYPRNRYDWFGYKNGWPCFDFKPEDEVVRFEVKEPAKDVTVAIFKGAKPKVGKPIVRVEFKRAA